ncbi:hypothetical protein AB0C27_42430 [Nonomuraea sp. NPDC048882]|uniref:hypothetical protein n=1 Tax=Nonomuraea sp. NPDC048882 TaxID=3154347 RepID=UPI003400F590
MPAVGVLVGAINIYDVGAYLRRGLSALLWTHLNLYGRFELDMNRHLELEAAPAGPPR